MNINNFNASVEGYRVLTEKDRSEWKYLLPSNFNVFASVENAEIDKRNFGYEPRLFVFQKGEGRVIYPFYFRPKNSLQHKKVINEPFKDIISPQYSCRFIFNDSELAIGPHFRKAFHDYCLDNNIVTEFAHLHPFDCNPKLLDKLSTSFDRDIVYVDLTLSEEQLWKNSFSTNCRKNIRRAQRKGLTIIEAKSTHDIREFYRVYTHTMERNNAKKKYFFRLEYFLDFWSLLPNNARYSLASYNNRIVGGLLTLHDSENVTAYLAGSDYNYKTLNMASLLHYEAIRWARQMGKKRYILGSGYHRNDGLFHFKSGFSPLRVKFYVYKRIHLKSLYQKLIRRWFECYSSTEKNVDFFPLHCYEPVQTPKSDDLSIAEDTT